LALIYQGPKASVSSYPFKKILKSTSLIGGASLANILIGMVRVKIVAVLIGPAGIGILGVYNAILGMAGTVVGMGLANSGVRQIAVAESAGDQERIARTVKTLMRTVWLMGALGMTAMILGCGYLSRASFGTSEYAVPVALLGCAVLLANVTIGQSCILQGTRRIGDLAKVSVMGALNGTVLSVPCLYFWGQQGIAPSMILTTAAGLVTAWWFARRVEIQPVRLSWWEGKPEVAELLHFGVPLMFSGLLSASSTYLISSLLVRQVGIEGVGQWQAAINLSSVMANFVLTAMGTDYFPRLTAVAEDNQRVREEVNGQTEISMLLAVPGLAATIIFAPLVIKLLYSGKFDGAVDILRWSVYGIFGRVISYPLGYVLLAKGRGKTFFFLEAFYNAFYVLAVLLCTQLWGLSGTGIAYLLLYVVFALMNYVVAGAISGAGWNRSNKWNFLFFGGMLVLVGLNSAWVASLWIRVLVNILMLVGLSLYCLRLLSQKSGVTLQTLYMKFHGL
jgi:PST family polysaccharide transporter